MQPAWDAIAAGAHKAPSCNPAHGRLAYLRSFTAAWVYTMMATIGVSLLERQRKYVEATDMLRQLLGVLQQSTLVAGCLPPLYVCKRILGCRLKLVVLQGPHSRGTGVCRLNASMTGLPDLGPPCPAQAASAASGGEESGGHGYPLTRSIWAGPSNPSRCCTTWWQTTHEG